MKYESDSATALGICLLITVVFWIAVLVILAIKIL